MDDLDPYRTAELIIEMHGDQAEWCCAEGMAEFAGTGDFEGLEAWKLILAEIRKIRLRGPAPGERVH